MKLSFTTIILLFLGVTTIHAQRNEGNDDNPYAKIYTETNPGKRTARCLKNLVMPDFYPGKFEGSPCNEFAEKGNTNKCKRHKRNMRLKHSKQNTK
jgi:hypothetical protein